MSLFPVILNASNYVDNSTYEFKFPSSRTFKNAKLAMNSISLYYSWRNIKEEYNNNKFSYQISGYPVTNVVIPDGNYEVQDLNQFLQNEFIKNGHYIRDTEGNNVYWIEILTNPNIYAVQLNIFETPSSLPTGFSNPANFVFPAVAARPTITFNADFGKILGLSAGTYSAASTLSTITPEVSPVSSVLVGCNLVNNEFTNPPDIIYSFTSGSTKYGSMIHVENSNLIFSDIRDGTYNSLVIRFYDNNFKKLDILDRSLIIYIIIKIDK
jgi:hypothetical protein